MITVSDRRVLRRALLLAIEHRNFSVTSLGSLCNARYRLLRNPVAATVSRSPPPQREDELKGPFQSSSRSSDEMPDGSRFGEMQGLADPGDVNSNIHGHLINTVLPVSLAHPRVNLDALRKQSVVLPTHSNRPGLSPTHQVM